MVSVIMKLANFPLVIDPDSLSISIAFAPIIVAALMATSGDIFMLIQASETTRFILPWGRARIVITSKGKWNRVVN